MLRPSPHALTVAPHVEVYRGGGPEWDRFVRGTAGGTFFHLLGWREVLAQTFGFRPHYLAARRGAALVGVLPLCEVRSTLRRRRLLSLPFTVEGGVCALDLDAQRALETAALALGADIGAERIDLRDGLDGGGFVPCEGRDVRFRRALWASDTENLAAMHRKQRRMVRIGQQSGLVARIDGDDLDVFYDLFSRSMRRLGTPVFGRGYFHLLRRAFGADCVLLTVRHQGRPVAAVLSFFMGDTVLPYYAGSRREYFRYAVNDFMYWELMRYARQRGARVFDFGRSKRGSGAYEFKRHWGFTPEPLRYRVWTADGRPVTAPRADGLHLLRCAWQHLPLTVTRSLGPALVRHLGVYYT